MTLECPECPYKTENGPEFIDHLMGYHKEKAEEIFIKFVNEGKIKIEVT